MCAVALPLQDHEAHKLHSIRSQSSNFESLKNYLTTLHKSLPHFWLFPHLEQKNQRRVNKELKIEH